MQKINAFFRRRWEPWHIVKSFRLSTSWKLTQMRRNRVTGKVQTKTTTVHGGLYEQEPSVDEINKILSGC